MFRRLFKSEHQHIEDLLSAYLDGELSSQERARVEKHLARCAACAQNLYTLRQTVALLGQLPPVAVPRSFAIRPAQVAELSSVFQIRRRYAYLRAATVLATVLFAVVVAGDVLLTGLAPYSAPAGAPEAIVREVPAVVETVVVEKEVPVTTGVEKEVLVKKKAAPQLTPLPAPAEVTEETGALQRVATPAVVGREMAPGAGVSATPEIKALVEAPRAPDEERIEATPAPMPPPAIATHAVPTLTAVVEALPATPSVRKPAWWAAVRPGRPELVILRVVEAGLLALVLVLTIATLVARRRKVAK